MAKEIRKFEIREIGSVVGYGLFDVAADDFTVHIAYASPQQLRRDVKIWAEEDRWPLDIEWREQSVSHSHGGSYNGIRF